MRNETALGLQEARGPWGRMVRFVLFSHAALVDFERALAT